MPLISSLKKLGLLLVSITTPLLGAENSYAPARRVVLQPVHEYFNIDDVLGKPEYGEQILNGFLNYTHLGTDFGFLGPGELHCTCKVGCICGDFSENGNGWAGLWHSLNGLARENRPLNLEACYPSLIAPAFQPRIVGLQAVATGTGNLKFELKSNTKGADGQPTQTTGWTQILHLSQDDQEHKLVVPIENRGLTQVNYLNWVAESGSIVCMDSLSFQVELPSVDFPTYVFLASYAKFARCYDEELGMVADRAHAPAAAFSNVGATGMFALATVAAQRLGIVEEVRARSILRRIMASINTLPRMRGLLPHFVKLRDGRWEPLSGSEYSTIDTTLCLFSIRLAANCLKDEETAHRALELLKGIEMNQLLDADGHVIHGLREDGKPLASVWRDWGGETALALMMQRIVAGPSQHPRMDDSGRSHRGIGFITELPALFFPKFNTSALARAGCVDWRAYRLERLAQQKAYFPKHAPDSIVAKLGVYGLSAGEGSHGRGYHVGGVEDDGERLVYPHYILMASLVEPDTAETYELLQRLESRGWLPPWGMVENIEINGSGYLPMIGSLNASFEALSAYHLLMQHRQKDDDLYRAADADPVFRDALDAVFE